MLLVLNFLMLIVFILISVAFFTLMERKVIGYIQNRIGPNKVGYMGFFQPFADMMKLFTKSIVWLQYSNFYWYIFLPIGGLFVSIIYWMVVSTYFWSWNIYYELIFLLMMISLGVYFIVGSGFMSNSKYTLLGSYRALAQSISYEVLFAMNICIIMILLMSFNLLSQFLIFLIVPIFIIWVSSCFAETNRHPFDLMEAESELTSGFNTEYGGVLFSILFLSEYMNMLFLSFMSMFLFFNCFFILGSLIIMCFFFWFRASFPRIRYDVVMEMNWKVYLLFVLMYLVFVVVLVM